MNPLEAQARNYRTFPELDVELPSGCAAILGENGAGKSSIVNLVPLALFAERGELAAQLTQGGDETETELELSLVFEHAGVLYRVRRGYSSRGRGKTTLDLEYLTAGAEDPEANVWHPLTRESQAETQKALEQILGLSRETFEASAFARQGGGSFADPNVKPAQRMELLSATLGLGRFETMLEAVKRDRRARELDVARDQAQTEALEAQATRREPLGREVAALEEQETKARTVVENAERSLAAVARELEQARASTVEAERAQAEERAAQAELEAVEAVKNGSLTARQALAELAPQLEALEARAASVAALEQQLEQAQRAEQDYQASIDARERVKVEVGRRELERLGRIAETNELAATAEERRGEAAVLEAAALDDTTATCDRCGQHLGGEARIRAIASYRAEADELDARANGINATAEQERLAIAQLRVSIPSVEPEPPDRERRAAVQRDLTIARTAAVDLAALRERGSMLEATRRAFDEATAERLTRASEAFEAAHVRALELRGAAAGVAVIANLENRLATERAAHLADQEWLRRTGVELAVKRAELAHAKTAEAELGELRSRLAEHTRELDLLAILERAFGRNGIPALVIESAAIPQLELEANRILGELGGATGSCRVELRTTRELKGGGFTETLDVVIVGLDGERPYETFSGGERTRINLALRIALARLLAHRRGAESRLLVIDEPEFLDEAGTAALADVLRGLTGDFERVLLVSHVPGLRDAFDQVLVVERDGESSRIAA